MTATSWNLANWTDDESHQNVDVTGWPSTKHSYMSCFYYLLHHHHHLCRCCFTSLETLPDIKNRASRLFVHIFNKMDLRWVKCFKFLSSGILAERYMSHEYLINRTINFYKLYNKSSMCSRTYAQDHRKTTKFISMISSHSL